MREFVERDVLELCRLVAVLVDLRFEVAERQRCSRPKRECLGVAVPTHARLANEPLLGSRHDRVWQREVRKRAAENQSAVARNIDVLQSADEQRRALTTACSSAVERFKTVEFEELFLLTGRFLRAVAEFPGRSLRRLLRLLPMLCLPPRQIRLQQLQRAARQRRVTPHGHRHLVLR